MLSNVGAAFKSHTTLSACHMSFSMQQRKMLSLSILRLCCLHGCMGYASARCSNWDVLPRLPAFERRAVRAGMAKGKQQLKARLEMLLWALTHSNALSPQASRFPAPARATSTSQRAPRCASVCLSLCACSAHPVRCTKVHIVARGKGRLCHG